MSDPETSSVMFQGKKEPQTIITPTFISHVKPVMTYPDDARPASSKVTRHHGIWAQEQMAGVGWWEMDRLVAFQVYEPWTIKN